MIVRLVVVVCVLCSCFDFNDCNLVIASCCLIAFVSVGMMWLV